MKRFLVAKFLAWIFIFFIFYSAQGEKFSWDSTSRQTVYENIFHFSFYYFYYTRRQLEKPEHNSRGGCEIMGFS